MPEGDPMGYAFLRMGDLDSQERLLAQQQAQASKLRDLGMQPSSKKDWASQMSRALQGFGSGMQQQQYQKNLREFGEKKQATLEEIAEMYRLRRNANGAPSVTRTPTPLPGALPEGYYEPQDVAPASFYPVT